VYRRRFSHIISRGDTVLTNLIYFYQFQVRKQSRRISHFRRTRTESQSVRSDAESSTEKGGSMNLNDMTEEIEEEEQNPKQPLRIPILMVLVVILAYTALGGLLFQVCLEFFNWGIWVSNSLMVEMLFRSG
jgi:hypothetical protein